MCDNRLMTGRKELWKCSYNIYEVVYSYLKVDCNNLMMYIIKPKATTKIMKQSYSK